MIKLHHHLLIVTCALLLLAACSSAPASAPTSTAPTSAPVAAPTDTPAPTATPLPTASAAQQREHALIEPLSDREIETIRLVAAGLSNKEIAQRLHISVRTVKFHMTNIYGKLGVDSRTQALARARLLGLILDA